MPKEIIKKCSDRNEYVLTDDGLWVRNFCVPSVRSVDINKLYREHEIEILLENELTNHQIRYPDVASEIFSFTKVIIISDGFEFTEKHKILQSLPSDVAIISTNKSLSKWTLVGKRMVNYYVVNNPFQECLSFLPKTKYFPTCIASTRTSPNFLKSYKGNKYLYSPTPDQRFSGVKFGHNYVIDDYRNPICAAVNFCYRMGVEKLVLFCCDDSFKEEKPSAIQLENNLWTYPQQITSQRIVDANLYWLKNNNPEISIVNCSSGIKLKHATYIKTESIMEFFNESQIIT